MSNIPEWYDHEHGFIRNDIYPFQKHNGIDQKFIARQRLAGAVKHAVSQLPTGWTIKWNASRKRRFRVNHSIKTIRVPFPKQRTGLPALGSAIDLARQIENALINARSYGQVPASTIKAWAFKYGSHFSVYYATHLPSCGWVSRNHKAVKQAGLQQARELLRFMQSPDAWRMPRYKAGSPKQWARPHIDRYTLGAIAHRKVLMDYLKVNDSAYPLPAIAKARLKKIQPTTQP